MLSVGFAGSSDAIPAFARKYETSCATCHSPFPKLNAFGNAYKANGYRMPPDDEEYTKDEQIPMGGEGQKRAFPNTIWPGDIPGGSVASFIIESNFNVHPDEEVQAEFDGIEEIGLLIGGTVGESWSFYGDMDLFEEGQPGEIGRLFVQYNRSPKFNVRAGQFEPRAVSFSDHRRALRMTGYLSNSFPIIPAGNFFGFSPSQKGIEMYGGVEGSGDRGGFEWALGVVNGEPGGAFEALEGAEGEVGHQVEEIEEAMEEHGGEFDVNNGKDVYARLSYKIGGLGIAGGGEATQAKNWRDNSLRLGTFLHRGTTGAIIEVGAEEEFRPSGNTFLRYGVDADWYVGDLNVLASASFLNDDIDETNETFKASVYTGEVQWVAYPWLIPACKLEVVDTDYGAGTFSRFSTELSMLAVANVKLLVGYTKSFQDAPELPQFEQAFRTGVNFAF